MTCFFWTGELGGKLGGTQERHGSKDPPLHLHLRSELRWFRSRGARESLGGTQERHGSKDPPLQLHLHLGSELRKRSLWTVLS